MHSTAKFLRINFKSNFSTNVADVNDHELYLRLYFTVASVVMVKNL